MDADVAVGFRPAIPEHYGQLRSPRPSGCQWTVIPPATCTLAPSEPARSVSTVKAQTNMPVASRVTLAPAPLNWPWPVSSVAPLPNETLSSAPTFRFPNVPLSETSDGKATELNTSTVPGPTVHVAS